MSGPRWIVLDGMSGSGKSTQAASMAAALRGRQVPVFETRCLWGTGDHRLQNRIRDLLLDPGFDPPTANLVAELGVMASLLTLDEGECFLERRAEGVVVQVRGWASVRAWWGLDSTVDFHHLRHRLDRIHQRFGLLHLVLDPNDPQWAVLRRQHDPVAIRNPHFARYLGAQAQFADWKVMREVACASEGPGEFRRVALEASETAQSLAARLMALVRPDRVARCRERG